VSKHEGEQALGQIAADTGMEVVIIRPPLVYGPGVKANFESMMRWLPRGSLGALLIALGVNNVGVIRLMIAKLVSGYTPNGDIVDWVFMEQEAEADRLGLGS
jgi:nucleoside-diphosphate-sugar epimerase